MSTKPSIVILGAGKIGLAVLQIIKRNPAAFGNFDVHAFDDQIRPSVTHVMNFNNYEVGDIAKELMKLNALYVVNCLPFFLNEKVAQAAWTAGANYLDFTEDDVQAALVDKIYRGRSGLTESLQFATKCGLAPGLVNYIGNAVSSHFDEVDDLTMMVGALPRNLSYVSKVDNYNITWSVDGLVNEYIRPCKVRRNYDNTIEVKPLTERETVLLNGVKYEAATTSGGVNTLTSYDGSIKNITYKTLRYPGHYKAVKKIIAECGGEEYFNEIKARFEKTFPRTDDDVIVLFVQALGKTGGTYYRRSVGHTIYGVDGLSAIQSSTAGAGCAVLELMVFGKLDGCITHKKVSPELLASTHSFKYAFSNMRD